jgi:pimeloyl-ACP methyl ester carboxylesterase
MDFIEVLIDGGFKYKVIDGAGHGINHEKPEIVNKEIINFITTIIK